MSDTPRTNEPSDDAVRRESARRTRRSFIVGGVAGALGLAGLRWLATADEVGNIPWPLRSLLRLNERLARTAFDPQKLARTFPPSRADAAADMRTNGDIGLGGDFNVAAWRMLVESDGGAARRFSIEDVRKIPRSEMVVELKCVEGWSRVFSWAGASLRDFMIAHRLGTRSGEAPDPEHNPGDMFEYVGLETPDGEYYIGIEMAAAWHPQTLLCYEMGGEPLTPPHGAPLRLAIPLKYGIKNLKRIGRMFFTDKRPPDFWGARGYDWYAGH